MLVIKIKTQNNTCELPLEVNEPVSIGSYAHDSFVIKNHGVKKGHLVFLLEKSGSVMAISKGNSMISQKRFKQGKLDVGEILTVCRGNKILFSAELCEKVQTTSIKIFHEMTVGKAETCSLVIKDSKVSRHHAEFYYSENAFNFYDLNSLNGSYINGRRVTKSILKNEDIISIVGYNFVYRNGELFFESRPEISYQADDYTFFSKDYPIVHPSPRIMENYPKGEIQIQNPPNIGNKPETNWFSVLAQPVAMLLIALLISQINKSSAQYSMLYTLPMSLISIISSVVNYFSQRKKYKKNFELKINKYSEYIQKTVNELKTSAKKQLSVLGDSSPETSSCLSIINMNEKRIWSRKSSDDDFLSIRIGSGEIEAELKAKFQNNGFELKEDDLITKFKDEAKKYSTIKNAPITVDFKINPVVGIYGNRESAKNVIKNMIVQATTFHSYTDFRIITLFTEKEKKDWEWVKWLPHSFNDDRTERYVSCNTKSTKEIIETVSEILKARRGKSNEANSSNEKITTPFYLFIVADEKATNNLTLKEVISEFAPSYGAGAIVLSESFDELPNEVSAFIDLSTSKSMIKTVDGSSITFVPDSIRKDFYEHFSRAMAPLKVADQKHAMILTNSITFLEGYKASTPQDIDIAGNWQKAKSYKASMAVPIGVKATGELFMFDIYDGKHGPFGVVAGMTGSGKTEMLQTWVLSIALNYSPQEISFVFIDFKGSGLFMPFIKMPHLAGTISDQDNESDILRSLTALRSELSRRKKLFEINNVDDYQKYADKYRRGEASEPLPVTVIIIDEFAEFKVAFPDFGTEIDSIVRTGRSFGVWAILATQNPSGIVSEQSNSNINFRWCLKVSNDSYSSEMLGQGHTEAARIRNPGRAYIKVGDFEVYEQIQSFWSGAPYNPRRGEKKLSALKISAVNLDGSRELLNIQDKTVGTKSYISEIDAVVNYINAYAEANHIPHAKKTWAKKLPAEICLPSLLENSFDGARWPESTSNISSVIGLVDDPVNQAQYPLKLNLSGEGHVLVYGLAKTGKTTLLQTLIMSLCLSYSPDDVNIYCMDFGSWTLGMFKNYPHVGGIANSNENDKIKKLFMLIGEFLNERKSKFSSLGVGNFKVYKDITGETLPFIVLVIDNLPKLLLEYPELQDFFVILINEGTNYGIVLVATATLTNSVNYKIADSIKIKFALQMSERSDYSSILGLKSVALSPEDTAGRGMTAINKIPVEYQTALPVQVGNETEKTIEIMRIAALMSDAWKGALPRPIPIMPDTIEYDSVRSDGITLGLSSHEVKPVFYDLELSHYILISGVASSGKTNLMKVIAKQFKDKLSSIIVVMDILNSWKNKSEVCDRYLTDIDEINKFFEDLSAELQSRRERKEKGDSLSDCLLIAIDNFDKFIDETNMDTVKRLSALMRIGKNLNVFLVVASDSKEIAERYQKSDSIATSLATGKVKIMLGGCYNSHINFDTDLTYAQKTEELGKNEAYLFNGTKTIKFKTIKG